jgi:hypothetical protein
VGRNREVFAYLKDHIEYLSLHAYVGNATNEYYDFLAVSSQLDDRIGTAAGTIRAALGGARPQKPIYIAFDEYNVWYRAGGNGQRVRRILEEHHNLEGRGVQDRAGHPAREQLWQDDGQDRNQQHQGQRQQAAPPLSPSFVHNAESGFGLGHPPVSRT